MIRSNGYRLIISHSRGNLVAGWLFWFFAFVALGAGCVSAGGTSLAQAEAAYNRADYQQVIRLLEAEAKPEAAAWMLLGKAQYQLGEFQAAGISLQRSLDAGNDTAECRMWLGRSLGMRADSANPFSAMGLARKARDQFQKAVALDPHDLEAVSDLFAYYLGAPSFLGGGTDKARALAESIRTVNEAEYRGMQAQLAEKAKDGAAAETWLRGAMDLEPLRIGRKIDLAKFYTRREEFAKADAALAEARALQPDAPRLLYDEASLLVRSGRNLARARQLLAQYQRSPRSSEDPSPFEMKQLSDKLEKLEKNSR